MKSLEKQVGGDHYKKFPVDPIIVAYDSYLDPVTYSVFKYIIRYHYKNWREDLLKAKHFLEIMLELHEENKFCTYHSVNVYEYLKHLLVFIQKRSLNAFQEEALIRLMRIHENPTVRAVNIQNLMTLIDKEIRLYDNANKG